MTLDPQILIFDYHNTLYDEVIEYGMAIDEAISFWIHTANRQGVEIGRTSLYEEIGKAHAELGSDWDERVWSRLPSLKKLKLTAKQFASVALLAEEKRLAKSKALTQSEEFRDSVKTLRAWKKEGKKILIVTEADATAAMRGIAWLNLSGVVDGVYTWPSHKTHARTQGAYQCDYPKDKNGGYIEKPHPYVIAQVILDVARREKKLPRKTTLDQVFAVVPDGGIDTQDLRKNIQKLSLGKKSKDIRQRLRQAKKAERACASKLIIKKTPYADVLSELLKSALFVGDSLFKDGLAARNAGIPFVFAQYGKKTDSAKKEIRAKAEEILYAVTGWDKFTLKLTQEAGQSDALMQSVKPVFTCENSLHDLFVFLEKQKPSWVEKLVRPELLSLQPYPSARNTLSFDQKNILLDASESPWPPYPGAPATEGFNRYPDPQPDSLLESFAKLYQVDSDQVMITRGIDEGIDLLARTFCVPQKDAILITPPTFVMYQIAARIQGVAFVEVPLQGENFEILSERKILKACRDSECPVKLVFLCHPNNPASTALDPNVILKICRALQNKALVVVDEAYIEFCPHLSITEKIKELDNLVVLRTLSKAHACAGVRCGCILARREVIQNIRRILQPYPLPYPVIQAVAQALLPESLAATRERIAVLLKERERMLAEFAKLSCIKKVFPSDANFFLVQVEQPDNIISLLRSNRIIARDRRNDVPGSIRIGLGTPEENDFLLKILKNIKR